MTDSKPSPPWGQGAPEFRVTLTHPISNRDHIDGRRSVLRIFEERSGELVLEMDFTSAVLHDLLTSREARPEVRAVGRHPERWGHEQTVTSATYATEEAAGDARTALEERGWQVDEIRKNNTGRRVVIGRRWDEEHQETCRGVGCGCLAQEDGKSA